MEPLRGYTDMLNYKNSKTRKKEVESVCVCVCACGEGREGGREEELLKVHSQSRNTY